ncbi:uncharacterized protein LOC105232932 [Bactrocera dorsalis]|uniref:Uncharacterized protein LOC105232932 n=1 Tax=Bactrocera dorsalis TaxID=27457 RepID=A0A6I9VLK2_BACDO|nr:uncharacterized protein LOC105232932 [Bactrocera dorsalis]
MRTQAATALYALLALACLGSTLCGLITEIGKPLQQAGNVVNELGSKISNTANIDSALSSVNTVKDAAKEVVDKITDLNPIENIIGIPSEISFLYKLISILKKLLSSIKLNVNAKHDQDKASTTVAVESTETTEAGPQDDQSSTVVATEISNDSEATESASEDPVNNSSEILTESVDESATADSVDISK